MIIASIFEIYLPLILTVASVALIFFMMGIYFIFKFNRSTAKNVSVKIANIASEPLFNVEAIAGDDFLATQLDLARAFIETGKKNTAENILTHVATHGTIAQQKEAQALLQLTKS